MFGLLFILLGAAALSGGYSSSPTSSSTPKPNAGEPDDYPPCCPGCADELPCGSEPKPAQGAGMSATQHAPPPRQSTPAVVPTTHVAVSARKCSINGEAWRDCKDVPWSSPPSQPAIATVQDSGNAHTPTLKLAAARLAAAGWAVIEDGPTSGGWAGDAQG